MLLGSLAGPAPKAEAERAGTVREDAKKIMAAALEAALPDTAVENALAQMPAWSGRLLLAAVGKAAWQMANAAWRVLGDRISQGVVITKYGHGKGPIGDLRILEGGHPVPDENGCFATQAALEMVRDLGKEDLVLFLVSGGGSALLEKPLIPLAELEDLTRRLLASGAQIQEINLLRKRFSGVKGGRFGALCAPAQVFSVVLSDVLGDLPEVIASGPAYPDSTTAAEALAIAEKYGLPLSEKARACLHRETPKALPNVRTLVAGSVRQLCAAAEAKARELGYAPVILTTELCCEAREAGSFLGAVAREYAGSAKSLAFFLGGETVVHVTGAGLGGRNQELALSAAKGLAGLEDTLVFSLGSDGTDGPTDAAGGWVDGTTQARLAAKGISIDRALGENDAYHALAAVEGLIFTGPTGTNVNDLTGLLIRREPAERPGG